MEFGRSTLAEFHAPSPEGPQVLAERARWLRDLPEESLLWNDGSADPAIAEFRELMDKAGFSGLQGEGPGLLLALGRNIEADLIFLNPAAGGEPVMAGGCLCFPSSWRPKEKLGLPVSQIHSVVPGLNEEIGPKIRLFLEKARPGHSWNRANWGLTASAELNQNPALGTVPMTADSPLESLRLRVELQSIVRLGRTGALVFGIRLWQRPLRQALRTPALRVAFSRSLQAMPEPLAQYKRLDQLRARLAREIEALPPESG